MSRELIAVAALVTALGRAAAQDVPTPILFLEKAYFAAGTPSGKNLLFEGIPSAHFFLFNGFGDLAWQKEGGFAFAMPISEMFVARMTRTASEPVLTPSFHIGPRLQTIWLRKPTNDPRAYTMYHFMTGLVHYSNGQHGCTYQGFTRDTVTGECDVTDAAVASQRLANTLDGDFSTTYIPLLLQRRRGYLIDPDSPLKWHWTLGAELQLHPFSRGIPGAPNAQQAIEYGQHQWSVSGEWECRRMKSQGVGAGPRPTTIWRLASDFTRRFGGGARPFNRGSIEASYVIDTVKFMPLRRVGLFARQSFGYDYYNIHFQERQSFWSVGLIFDPGRLDRLEPNLKPGMRIPRDRAANSCLTFWRRVPV